MYTNKQTERGEDITSLTFIGGGNNKIRGMVEGIPGPWDDGTLLYNITLSVQPYACLQSMYAEPHFLHL